MLDKNFREKLFISLLDKDTGKDTFGDKIFLENKGLMHILRHMNVDYKVNHNVNHSYKEKMVKNIRIKEMVRYAQNINILEHIFNVCANKKAIVCEEGINKGTLNVKLDECVDDKNERNITRIAFDENYEILSAYPVQESDMERVINRANTYYEVEGNQKNKAKSRNKANIYISPDNPIITYEMIKKIKRYHTTMILPTSEIILNDESNMRGKIESLKEEIRKDYEAMLDCQKNNKTEVSKRKSIKVENRYNELIALTKLNKYEKTKELINIEKKIKQVEDYAKDSEIEFKYYSLNEKLNDELSEIRDKDKKKFLMAIKTGKDIERFLNKRVEIDDKIIESRREVIANTLLYVEECLTELGAKVVEELPERLNQIDGQFYIAGEDRALEIIDSPKELKQYIEDRKMLKANDDMDYVKANMQAIREFGEIKEVEESDIEEDVTLEKYWDAEGFLKGQQEIYQNNNGEVYL